MPWLWFRAIRCPLPIFKSPFADPPRERKSTRNHRKKQDFNFFQKSCDAARAARAARASAATDLAQGRQGLLFVGEAHNIAVQGIEW